jgi:hypothetical protein
MKLSHMQSYCVSKKAAHSYLPLTILMLLLDKELLAWKLFGNCRVHCMQFLYLWEVVD